jgi:choline transport protein
MGAGFLTAFLYLIAILYSIHDFAALSSSAFPIAEIYAQATGSPAGAIGLLFLLLLPSVLTVVRSYITIGRGLWTLARDGATPFSEFLSKESPALGMPFNATIACAILNTLLGCLYLGSTTAFGALVGSVATLTTASYTAAILPNLLTGRKDIRFGPFHMKWWLGFVMNGVACTYMIVFFIIFCFPYHLPTNAKSMNYSSLIFGGMTIFVTAWYFLGNKKGYKGPRQSEASSTKQTWSKRFRKLLRKHRKPRSHIDIPSRRPLNCLTTTPARFQLANSSAYHIRISDELILSIHPGCRATA